MRMLLAIALYAPAAVLAGSPYVEEVERRLAALGYVVGAIDGEFDAALSTALLNFQAAEGLPADGRLTRETHDAVLRAPSRPGSAPAPAYVPPRVEVVPGPAAAAPAAPVGPAPAASAPDAVPDPATAPEPPTPVSPWQPPPRSRSDAPPPPEPDTPVTLEHEPVGQAPPEPKRE